MENQNCKHKGWKKILSGRFGYSGFFFIPFPRDVQYYCLTPMRKHFCTFFTWNQFHEFFPDFTYRAMHENCLMLYLLYNCHAITISTLILYSTKVLTYYITTLNSQFNNWWSDIGMEQQYQPSDPPPGCQTYFFLTEIISSCI